MSSIVAIVGRPNVGKSTLFNRLVQRREAIVDSVSGVTRDRHYGKSDWNGKEFSVIDTGGYIVGSDDIFEGEIRKQVQLAIEESDIIVFVVDVEEGITPMDAEVAKMPEPEEVDLEKEELPRFAVVGRPNAGKSSFINALIGEDRNIVTNIAGTTRDSIDTKYNRFGFDFNLVDTAGIRKKSKVKEDLEFYSVMRAVRTIEYSDVVILMVDATRGFESQDQNIFWLADKNRKGVIILINKWDLVEKETNTMRDFEAQVRRQIAPFTDVPIIFTSVLTKQRLLKAIETAVEVFENRKRRISTSKLNETMLEIVQQNSPPATKGKFVKIKYCMQLPTPTPQFAFFSNLPQYVKDPYKRYVENQLREHYNFSGVPITIYFRQK